MCGCVGAQYSNLYLLAMCRSNVNAASVLVFLHRILDVFKHYFTELEEESLRDNFVIAYELLDEVYPPFPLPPPPPLPLFLGLRSDRMSHPFK
jgi:hypothetical protein